MIKGILFLSGGGSLKESFELDKRFFACLKDRSKILYIPIALNRDKVGFEACRDWFSSMIENHRDGKNIKFDMILQDDSVPDLDEYDAIYIGGGNTFKLLNYIYINKLVEVIINYINKGKIVYGGSAGAIILGKDIRTVEEENDQNFEYYNGLNLLDDRSLMCHYEKNMDNHLYQATRKIKSPIFALKEDCGLIVTSGKIESIGQVFIFNEDGTKDVI